MTAGLPLAPLIVISGIQGAGKTTIARAVAGRLPRAAHIEADALARMVVSGLTWPEGAEMSNEAALQLRLRLHNACLLARSFTAEGIAAVLDDIVLGSRVDDLLSELAGTSFYFVMLTPDVSTVAQREAGRGTNLYEAWAWLDEEMRERTQRLGFWLDTTGHTVDETVDVILARLATDGLVHA